GSDKASVDALAETLASQLWSMREDFEPNLVPVDEALRRASELVESGSIPLVLSDQGDNPGGGAPAKSTVLLEALEDRPMSGTLVASLMAPEAVGKCHEAGVGSVVKIDLGDFTAEVDVIALADGNYTIHSPTHPNVPVAIGPLALVRTQGTVEVVLTSTPLQNEDLQVFDNLGVDPLDLNLIVVKSNVHFRAAFEPIASAVIDVDTPGISTPKLVRLPYRRVRRPIWPLDGDMSWSPS
ncbi:MAG: MlrC C-terminal domain-containing protein, partial [Microthrixaceae bacterium]